MKLDITDEVRAAHADLGPLSTALLDDIAADPEARARRLPIDRPDWLRYPYPYSPWPALLGAGKLREIERATAALSQLTKLVPERVFGNDPKRLAEHYKLGNEMVAAFLISPPNGIPGAIGRCDLMDTPDGFKCLEMNMSGYIGGWVLRFADRQFRSHPELARFFAEHGVTPVFRDPWRELLVHVVGEVRRGPVAPASEINLAVAIDDPWPELIEGAAAHFNPVYSDLLAGLGAGLTGRLVFTSYKTAGFTVQRGMRLSLGGLPIHGVIEHCDHPTPQDVFRCFKAETVQLYNGIFGRVLSDKRNLALLSEHAGSGAFDAAERELIARHIPWSRPVVDRIVTWQGEETPLRDLLLAHQERFVVKPAAGLQGLGVAVGPRLGRQAWEQAVAGAFADGGFLAQEALAGRPLLGPRGGDDGGGGPSDVVWGTFCYGDRYGGGFLRMVPRGVGDGIVNSSRGATEGLLFEV